VKIDCDKPLIKEMNKADSLRLARTKTKQKKIKIKSRSKKNHCRDELEECRSLKKADILKISAKIRPRKPLIFFELEIVKVDILGTGPSSS
jgi:hypothetical protein